MTLCRSTAAGAGRVGRKSRPRRGGMLRQSLSFGAAAMRFQPCHGGGAGHSAFGGGTASLRPRHRIAARNRKMADDRKGRPGDRSEEHTSELQSLMRISYAVFCLKK